MTSSGKRNVDAGQRAGDAPDGAAPPPKAPDADDPMQLRAGVVAGNPLAMLEGLIEEYARMGWDADQIATIFDNPFFAATHGLSKQFGRAGIRETIEQTLQRCGVFRFDTIESKPAANPLPCMDTVTLNPLSGERNDA
jgi:hypothetical protein